MDIQGKDMLDVFYSSWAWRKCKDGYIVSIRGLCERCLKKGLIVPVDEVHHKVRLTPQIALNWNNLEGLCVDCHKQTHRKTKRWRVDEDGNVTLTTPLTNAEGRGGAGLG